MREIKFRAWDIENSIMAYNIQETYDSNYFEDVNGNDVFFAGGNPHVRYFGWPDVFGEFLNKPDIAVMQYTGLKDKNGKEIYEGDIVIATNRLHECEVKQNVHFLNGCFMFGNWNAHEFFNRHQNIQVIGNIYENPELLK